MLSAGDSAPDFELISTDGSKVKLSSLRGLTTVLYFYPKDMTPGCTTQACSYRDSIPKFKERKINVFGISLDSQARHKKFTEKYNLNFPLLVDEDHKVSDLYGVYGEKKFMGKTYYGITRTTFVIDSKGKIIKIWKRVKPKEDVDNVLKLLDENNKKAIR